MAFTHDVIVIGAGSAGLTAAGGLGQLGLRVALIERDRMGGECLNTGCVPSKALLAVARHAQAIREAGRFGIEVGAPAIDWGGVMAHVHGAIATIAPHDSAERFEAWGVEVLRGDARLAGQTAVHVGERVLRAPRIVLATGSRPAVPSIPGLDALPFLTNETLFHLETRPDHLLIVGGGAIGCEMAQAFRRLGAAVTLVEQGRCLAHSDPDAAALVVGRLRDEGVAIHEGAQIARAEGHAGDVAFVLADGTRLAGSHILVATGRTARTDGLGLEAIDVAVGADGIAVDRHQRTSVKTIRAIGDCRAGPRFTHAAGSDGERIVASFGYGLPSPRDYAALPRVTYTDPELAEAGEAARDGDTVLTEDFADNDRAVTEGKTAGFCRLVLRRGKLVGITIVGAGAGDLLAPYLLALAGKKASPWGLAGLVLPYPIRGEAAKAAAFQAFAPRLFSSPARRWAGGLGAWRRMTTREGETR